MLESHRWSYGINSSGDQESPLERKRLKLGKRLFFYICHIFFKFCEIKNELNKK